MPGKAIKLPRQTRVTPEEYKEFLALGHGEIFDLDMDRCGQDLGEVMKQLLPCVWTGVGRMWVLLWKDAEGFLPGHGHVEAGFGCRVGAYSAVVMDRCGQDLGAVMKGSLLPNQAMAGVGRSCVKVYSIFALVGNRCLMCGVGCCVQRCCHTTLLSPLLCL